MGPLRTKDGGETLAIAAFGKLAAMFCLVALFSFASIHTHDDDHEEGHDAEASCTVCLIAIGKKWVDGPTLNQLLPAPTVHRYVDLLSSDIDINLEAHKRHQPRAPPLLPLSA